jgi:hypothetical protein
MRQSNSFSDGEIDLLEQIIAGLTRGQRDLVHLVRHESFVSLANKARTMGALSRGEAKPVNALATGERMSKAMLRVLDAVRREPGKSARHYSQMVDRHRQTVCDALLSLMDAGKVERTGTNHETAYWPKGAVSNVVQLSERKAAVR